MSNDSIYQAKSGISSVSNSHKNELRYEPALKKLLLLINESEKLQFSGVNLKDATTDTSLENHLQQANLLLDRLLDIAIKCNA